MKKIQTTPYKMYYTTIEGHFDTFVEMRDFYKFPKTYLGVQNINKVKRFQHLEAKQHIIKGSEPLLEYKWHPKFTDYCVDIKGNVFRYKKEYGYKQITAYKNDHPLWTNDYNDYGYATIQPYLGRKRYIRYHHRFVAETWVPNPHNHRCVNHINEVKWDNRVENLEWTTYKKNNHHSRERRAEGIRKYWQTNGHKVKTAQVREWIVSVKDEVIATGHSLKSIADKLDMNPNILTHIHRNQPGKKWANWKVEKTYNTIEYTGQYYVNDIRTKADLKKLFGEYK